VPLLALGAFLMCTTEYIVAGLMPDMAGSFGVSPSQVGSLVTVFAVGMMAAPVMAIITRRLPQRATLILALAVYATGHVVAALSASFEVMIAARALTALVTGAFWAVGSVVATRAAGPAAAARALGVMGIGVGLSNMMGVPLGSWAGQVLGWRGAFWGLAALAVLVALAIALTPLAKQDRVSHSVAAELRGLGDRRIWLLLAAAVLVIGGVMGTFTYISPLATDRMGLPLWAVPLVLVAFGVGALIGTGVGGRLGDRSPLGTFIGAAVVSAIALAVLVPLSTNPVTAVTLILLAAAAGMAVPPVATVLAVRYVRSAPTLAAALAVAAFNGGTAIGSWIDGEGLRTSLRATAPAAIGAVMAALALAPLLVLAATQAARVRRSTSASGGRQMRRDDLVRTPDRKRAFSLEQQVSDPNEVVVISSGGDDLRAPATTREPVNR
jgi:predicted MFS family arabinose efflux permease